MRCGAGIQAPEGNTGVYRFQAFKVIVNLVVLVVCPGYCQKQVFACHCLYALEETYAGPVVLG